MSEEDDFTRDVMARAIRRLNILEYVILGLAALLALLGGALVSWLLSETLDIPFRLGWAISSLLLFVVPGGIVYARENLSSGPGRRGAGGEGEGGAGKKQGDTSENRMESADG